MDRPGGSPVAEKAFGSAVAVTVKMKGEPAVAVTVDAELFEILH